jgi:hypothetical protein
LNPPTCPPTTRQPNARHLPRIPIIQSAALNVILHV